MTKGAGRAKDLELQRPEFSSSILSLLTLKIIQSSWISPSQSVKLTYHSYYHILLLDLMGKTLVKPLTIEVHTTCAFSWSLLHQRTDD